MAARKPVLPVIAVCCVLVGWLVWACVPALAAAPETPEKAAATGVEATAATLRGVLNPHGERLLEPGSYEFRYRQSRSECEGGEPGEERATSAIAALGQEKEAVEASVGELSPNTTYTFCLRAFNEAGEEALGAPESFMTLAEKPDVSGVSVSLVQSNNATVNAQIDTGGLQTTYRVKYGPTSSYGLESTASSLSEGAGTRTVSVFLSGLQPAIEYHFRVVAENAKGGAESSDQVFTTFPESNGGLPDGRVYEMVSPVEDDNANVFVPRAYKPKFPGEGPQNAQRPMQVAADGDGVAYLGEATTGGNGQSTQSFGNQYLATRDPEGGWSQRNIQPDDYSSPSYLAFSRYLSQGILTTNNGNEVSPLPPISPEELPGDYWNLFQHATTGGAYEPLIPSAKVSLHRPPGEDSLVPIYAGSSSDFSQSFFEVNDALTFGAVDGGPEKYNLYDSVDGRLTVVNILPDGASEPNAAFGQFTNERRPGAASNETSFENESDFSHVISSDGSRVFWTDLNTTVSPEDPSGEIRLFMRENPAAPQSPVSNGACTVMEDACTIQVDASVGGGGRFWTANANGSRVFFTKGALYEYDVENGQTMDLSEGHNVEGVLGASEDGSYVYFIEEGHGLYVSYDALAPKLIATLGQGENEEIAPYSGNCNCGGNVGDWVVMIGRRTAEVSANGTGLVFMSNQSLTGYQNDGLQEVYVYDAEDGGRLFCASCNRSGEPPQTEGGPEALQFGAAGFLPVSHEPTFMPQLISDDGARVFFDSGEPLVPNDTDGKQDVYEWERDGTGSCGQAGGCIYLLSGGDGAHNSWLLGSDPSGDNVFIVSRTHLLEEGQGDEYALYDARVGGVLPVQPPACTGTGCQGVPEPPPVFATPPSVTYAGIGNFPPRVPAPVVKARKRTLTRAQRLTQALKVCKKKAKSQRSSCEARAKRRYGASSRVKNLTAKRGK
jgi:hypothetical protein